MPAEIRLPVVKGLPFGLAALVIAVAVLVLIGWAVDSATLKGVTPGLPPMKPNTAVALLLEGLSLLFIGSWKRLRVIGFTCAVAAGLIALITLCEYAFGGIPHFDEFLFKDYTSRSGLPPGRISPITAFNLVLVGTALALRHLRGTFRATQALVIPAACISFVSFAGYLYNSPALYTFGPFESMAVHTCVSLLLLSAGIVLTEPERGVVAALRLPNVSGVFGRRLLAAAFGVPLLGGWLTLRGQRMGLYGPEFGLALFTVATTLVLVLLICWNVTSLWHMDLARSRAEEALGHNYALLNAVVEDTTEAIFIKDLTGRYVMVNAVTAGIMERPRATILGKNDTAFFPSEIARALMETDQRIIHSGLAETLEETVIHQGKPRIMLSTKAPWHNEAGVVMGVIGVARDITERKKLEAQFFQAQKMEAIGRLAGGVAHDFNNLLTAILGYTALIVEEVTERPWVLECADEVRGAAERASALTNQLLAFSRRQMAQPRTVNLNDIVRQIYKMLERIIGEDIQVETKLAGDLQPVKIDPAHMDQVILNLAVNSRDAMPHGGKLVIETANVQLTEDYAGRHIGTPSGFYAMLAVADTGTGMASETKSHLFEPFFTTKEEGKGTGLGLSIVYGIVKQNGGDILVYSEPGQGTAFKIYLPVATEPAESLFVTASEPLRAPAGETILLVEDQAQVRNLARTMLARRGYRVLEAASAAEALDTVRAYTGPIDLLLTDMVMPQMNGVELYRQISAIRRLNVLYMSGYTDTNILDRGALAPGTPFLQKPFTVTALNQKVREALSPQAS